MTILLVLALGLLAISLSSGEFIPGIAAGIVFLIIGFGVFATDLQYKSGENRTLTFDAENNTIGHVDSNIYSTPSEVQTNSLALLLTVLGIGIITLMAWLYSHS